MRLISLCFGILGLGSAATAADVVFFDDFNGSLPAAISPGSAMLTGVQGFSGLGPTVTQFGGNFLRSETGNTVSLTLTGLPAHSAISLDFLFAAIDSLDGTGTFPAGDFFTVTLDGSQIFRESFANADPNEVQSYVPPPGVQLARRVDLGFSGPGGFYTDSAYYLGADPTMQTIGHSGPSAAFTFRIEGVGIQDLNDESWAMDNLRVTVTVAPEPSTVPLAAVGVILLTARRNKRQRALTGH